MPINFSREVLSVRHRLSHQQIDKILGENKATHFINDKIRGLNLVHYFIHLIEILEQLGVEYTSIKGPLLSQIIYNDASVRISHDFDILVDKKDASEIYQQMLTNGFISTDNFIWPKDPRKQDILMDAIHHIGFRHAQLGYMVEIHWVLTVEPPIAPQKLKELVAANTKWYTFYGHQVRSLNEEMMLAYLLFHGSKHGWQRLKWLVDIKDYPIEKISIPKFHKLADSLNLSNSLALARMLLQYYFDLDMSILPPKKLPQRTLKYCHMLISSPVKETFTIREGWLYFRYRITIASGLRYKLRMLSMLLISISDINSTTINSRLLFILYRPLGFIKRRLIHA